LCTRAFFQFGIDIGLPGAAASAGDPGCSKAELRGAGDLRERSLIEIELQQHRDGALEFIPSEKN